MLRGTLSLAELTLVLSPAGVGQVLQRQLFANAADLLRQPIIPGVSLFDRHHIQIFMLA